MTMARELALREPWVFCIFGGHWQSSKYTSDTFHACISDCGTLGCMYHTQDKSAIPACYESWTGISVTKFSLWEGFLLTVVVSVKVYYIHIAS